MVGTPKRRAYHPSLRLLEGPHQVDLQLVLPVRLLVDGFDHILCEDVQGAPNVYANVPPDLVPDVFPMLLRLSIFKGHFLLLRGKTEDRESQGKVQTGIVGNNSGSPIRKQPQGYD